MSAGILKYDAGVLAEGTAWHNNPQYEILPDGVMVSIEKARICATFPIEKKATWVIEGCDDPLASGAYAIVRTDTEPWTVLAPAVGARYVALPHREILDAIHEGILKQFPLEICGTGTLNNGRTWWIQMKIDNFRVFGDDSPNELRLCYSQSYGETSHMVFCTLTRIVCQNTLRMAVDQSILSNLMQKLRHTSGAGAKITAKMEAMAEINLGLSKHRQMLNELASYTMSDTLVNGFINEFFPKLDPKASPRAINAREDSVSRVLGLFNGGNKALVGVTAHSKYAMLNAFTDWADHYSPSRDKTGVDRWMNAQNGSLATLKDKAVEWLVAH